MTHEELIAHQIQEFPTSVIITWEEFEALHKDHDEGQHEVIRWYKKHHPEAVCYYLKDVSFSGGHYNGIRFGELGDYCSFLHVQPLETN